MEKGYIILPPFVYENYSIYLSLTGLFHFYSRLYSKIYFQFEESNSEVSLQNVEINLFLPSNFIYKTFQNKKLLLNHYDMSEGIPYNIRFLYEHMNRNIEKENEIKNKIICSYENVIPHFVSSSLLTYDIDKEHTNIPFYSLDKNFYENDIEHPYYHCHLNLPYHEYLYLGTYIENVEELHIHSHDTLWLEFMMYINLSKITKRVLYVYNESDMEDLKRKYTKICYFRIIYI